MTNQIIPGDCLDVMHTIDAGSIDCIVTDPPYGISFMGKQWDKAVPYVDVWKQCLRVLKPGAFAFVMCIPRQDCLARMIVNLEDSGFNVAFGSIYWTYASGFPKAQNLSKVVDKRAGAEREVLCKSKYADKGRVSKDTSISLGNSSSSLITIHSTNEAKALDGAYGGFQPKPAVEVIIVAMKPLSEKTYVDQAMSNMHGCTWLDDCRIPYESNDFEKAEKKNKSFKNANNHESTTFKGVGSGDITTKGRFPANVICEDNVLDDGTCKKSGGRKGDQTSPWTANGRAEISCPVQNIMEKNEGSFSRYFSLDAWFAERIKQLSKEAQKTFPWLIVPKASKGEKNKGLEYAANVHATVKPIKLRSWLITLGTREGDTVLDPFVGSGTTCIAAKTLGRQYIGIECEEEYVEIARKRLAAIPKSLSGWVQK